MKLGLVWRTAVIIFLSIPAAFLFPGVSAAELCAEWIGKAVSVQGDVQALREGEKQWKPARLNDTYCPGDTIRLQERSRAVILLANDSILRLDQNTTVVLSGTEKEKTFLLNLRKGIAHFFSRFRRSLKVGTPFVNATVEGTEFLVKVESSETFMSVFEGKVEFANEKGSLLMASGQSAAAAEGQAPVLRVVARPRDAVQWTLYYPPVFPHRPSEVPSGPGADWRTKVSYLLSVGRVDEAKAEIEGALESTPGNSDALSVGSVIAVAQNDKEKALGLAKKAVDADPDSAAARIALSYALQARFDLEGALESLKEAVKREPNNALAWARLAEMWLSFGNLEESLKAAKKAIALSPDVARAQTVSGFAHLMKVETKEAKDAFEKAIMLDQADPLPRLGLGLEKIREGNLAEGRKEIEIAESLDPDNSLIRSYLGKAYYEEKRDEKASEQFVKAEEFDPLDPTPWFYDAIRKQSTNRPVEALHDLQKSIELNDNRAVYRSKLLLDEDLAARSASLARIYSDLGFQQLALVEGWKSVNTDPGIYSAHRFLADSYAALPRHEIARVSELLQSQLLQPLNINPVQPSLAESNLFILEGAGPSNPAFNEFNPLFNRNRVALQASGVAGSNSTFGEEIVVSAVKDKFSVSAGQFHYETDGFRENNDLKQDIYNVFAQYSFTEKTSIQAEFRAKDVEKGDLTLNFLPDGFLPNLRERDENRSIRFGFHHAFSSGSDLIGSMSYQHAEFNVRDATPFFNLEIRPDADGYSAELQHLLRSGRFSIITGAGYFKIGRRETVTTEIPLPPPLPSLTLTDVTDTGVRHTNLYLYSNINYPDTVTWTIGGSTDFLKGEGLDRNQFNPKLGLTWRILPGSSLRAAVFRTLKRTLITDQTLESTQVAGFNQFFDDGEGTEVWRYGIAVDQRFSKDIYGGAEYSRRDLEVPFTSICLPPLCGAPTVDVLKADWNENTGRAYFYWTPHSWLALSAEYRYEKFSRDPEFVAGIKHVETHSFPLGIGFFHPGGFSARMKANYINQKGEFQSQGSPPGIFDSGADDFWLVDASLSYRLPNRLGLISLIAKNLFDKSFKFQDIDPASPAIQPKRSVFLKFTLAL
jgi:tetratricopeptide (TPR) repeat protein